MLHSEAFISVNIDPEDLDRVSDFFHSIIINEQPQAVIQTPTPRVITYIIYKKMNMLGVHRIMSYIRLFNNPFFCWDFLQDRLFFIRRTIEIVFKLPNLSLIKLNSKKKILNKTV